jgi:glycosyltransferase involved in cell wall biosynthesis
VSLSILLWSPHGAGEHYGGPGSAAFRLYALPAARSLRVTLAHGYRDQAAHPEVFADQRFVAPAVKRAVVRVSGVPFPHPTRAVRHAAFIRAARRFVRERAGDYDVFHGLMAYDQTVRPAAEAQRRGLPALVKVAQQQAELAGKGGPRPLGRRIERRRALLGDLSGVIALSRAIGDELLEAGVPEGRIAYVPNGVDTARFRPVGSDVEKGEARARLGWADLPTALFVGAIIERKRPHLLVTALGLLARGGLDCRLVLAGPADDDAYAARLRTEARRHGVEDRLDWSPFRPDIEQLYRAADLFCLPSRGEGLSNAMLEAMASGLPVVCTEMSGTHEIFSGEEVGGIADPDPAALAAAMAPWLEDAAARARAGAAARLRAVGRFSAEAVLDLHERLFRHVVAGGLPAEVAPRW